MPWIETCAMEERIEFISFVKQGLYSMTELCCHFHISRKTGYKWLERYRQFGLEGLSEQSRAPHHPPHALSALVHEAILLIKERFPDWGARKIRARMEHLYPMWDQYPAISTIGLLLQKEGLTRRSGRRARCSPTESPLTDGQYSNHVWCADFKGHFRTGDGFRCNPLTISDHCSRYLLCCRHLERATWELARKTFERVFRQYGLPEVIRTDNGAPFGSVGLGGLSRLAYWWIRLGIHPERIEPGHPEQNGRHERMHKTLKANTARPPAATIRSQQKRFDTFRRDYNEQRPHEALRMRTPSSCYQRSRRTYPSRLPEIEYPDSMQVKRVQTHGDVIYRGRRLFVTENLYDEYVGIEEKDEAMSLLWYSGYLLGQIDHLNWCIIPTKPTCKLRPASWTGEIQNL